MGKLRKKRFSKAVHSLSKKTSAQNIRKENPFDLIFKKKQKQNSRQAGSIQNGKSYQNRSIDSRKSGQLIDKRLSQRNFMLTAKEKAEQRSILQQKRFFASRSAKVKFNLNQDEELDVDHLLKQKGEQTYDDEELDGELDFDLLARANFGGGEFEKDREIIEEELERKVGNRRAEILSNIISMSKRAKALRQMQKNAQDDLTDEINEKFMTLQKSGILVQGKIPIVQHSNNSCDINYDSLYRDLQTDQLAMSSKMSNIAPTKRSKAQDLPIMLKEFEQQFQLPTEENVFKLKNLVQTLHQQLKKNSSHISKLIHSLLIDLRSSVAGRKAKNIDFATFAFFDLVCQLFPATENHPISSSTLFHAIELITNCRIRTPSECARIVLLCNRLYHWIDDESSSKHKIYIPEVINFLQGALQMCVTNSEPQRFPSMSFPVSFPHREMLLIRSKLPENINESKLSLSAIFSAPKNCDDSDDRFDEENNDEFKVPIIRILLETINVFSRKYSEKYPTAFLPMFSTYLGLLKQLPLSNYPSSLSNDVSKLQEQLTKLSSQNSQVTHLRRIVQTKVRIIPQLEPKFDDGYNPEINTRAKDDKLRQRRMTQKLRKEMRGAIKELRKDAKCISDLQRESDEKIRKERREKTKRIMQGLQMQESEFKKRKLKK